MVLHLGEVSDFFFTKPVEVKTCIFNKHVLQQKPILR